MRKVDHLIIGGGPAGLSLAYEFQQKGIDFLLIEKTDHIGGNAITYEWKDMLFDSGAHRVHGKIPRVTQRVKEILGDDLALINKPSAIYSQNQFFTFPFQAKEVIQKIGKRKTFKVALEQLAPRSEGNSFQSKVLHQYGPYLSQRFLLPYTEKLWGAPCDQLMPEISGNRLSGVGVGSWLMEKLTGKSTHLEGKFYYPTKGIGMLFDEMQKAIPSDKIRLNSTVDEFKWDSQQIKQVRLGEEWIEVGKVYSSIPSTIVSDMTVGPKVDLKFRHVRLLAVEVLTDEVTPFASVYFSDGEVPFTRCVESKHRSSQMSPANKTVLVFEIPCYEGDEYFSLSEEALFEKIKPYFPLFLPQNKIADYTTKMIYNAYPVLSLNAKKELVTVNNYLNQFSNLQVIGRNGKFQYLHIHDLMDEAIGIADKLQG